MIQIGDYIYALFSSSKLFFKSVFESILLCGARQYSNIIVVTVNVTEQLFLSSTVY